MFAVTSPVVTRKVVRDGPDGARLAFTRCPGSKPGIDRGRTGRSFAADGGIGWARRCSTSASPGDGLGRVAERLLHTAPLQILETFFPNVAARSHPFHRRLRRILGPSMTKARALHASLTILLAMALGCGVREEKRQTTTDTTAAALPPGRMDDRNRIEYEGAAERRLAELGRIDSHGVVAQGPKTQTRDDHGNGIKEGMSR